MVSNSPGGSPESSNRGWSRLWAAVHPALDVHPVEPGALGEYALVLQEQGAAAAERAFPEVARHVHAGCEQCADGLAEFQFTYEPEKTESLLQRMIATLVAVPPRSSQRAGLRGMAEPSMRGYLAGDITISISTFASDASGTTFALEGLVTVTPGAVNTLDLTGAEARLSKARGEILSSPVDAHGNFGFDEVAAGRYDLELRFTDHDVAVEDLLIGNDGGSDGGDAG